MANPKIDVEIGANVVGLTNGVNTATGQLDKLGKAAQATAPQIQRLGQATQGYNSVGIDFARIIQDAPFGIIGVGNNITQLAGSFQVLKNSTGSTGAALKSALGSILSSGNALVLGISILTTLFTVLQQKGFFKTEEAAKSLSDQLEEFRENLDGIAKATLQGQINAQKEISNYKLLQVQAENTTLSLEKRIAAVNELRKLAPEYLKNLTDEQILTGNVGDAYKSLTNDILALAKAKAFSAQIDKNSADTLTLLLQEEQRAIVISQKRQDQEKARREDEQRRAIGAAAGGFGSAAISEAASIESKIKDLIDEQVTSAQERARLAEQNIKLEAGIVGFNSQGATFAKVKTEETKKNVTANEEIKRSLEEIQKIEFNRPAVSFQPTPNLPGVDLKNIQAQIQNLTALNQQLQASGLSVEQFYAAIANGAANGFTSFDNFVKSVSTAQQFFGNAFQALEQGIENTIGNVAFAIGDALASGGNALQAGGAALLDGIAGIMNQLGQMAIEAGFTVLSIKKSLETLNPYVAIAAGIALVALAGAVSAKAKKISKSSGGGGGGGSSVGSSGIGGGSSFVGGGAQGGMFAQNRDVSGEFVVRGQDLVYVLGQSENRIKKG
jgi:uncharacterized membrane protein YgcG